MLVFGGGYRIKGNSIQLNQEIVLGKRIYEAADWNEFREAVKGQKKISEMPVVLKKIKLVNYKIFKTDNDEKLSDYIKSLFLPISCFRKMKTQMRFLKSL